VPWGLNCTRRLPETPALGQNCRVIALPAPVVAMAEVLLLGWGAAASAVFTSRAAKRIPRAATLMAAGTAWIVLFGLVPFAGFALLAPAVAGSGDATPHSWAVAVLNVVPFALVAAPVVGLVQGIAVTRRGTRRT
jgi:hypothetical protein